MGRPYKTVGRLPEQRALEEMQILACNGDSERIERSLNDYADLAIVVESGTGVHCNRVSRIWPKILKI
jgi:hypothetical protein